VEGVQWANTTRGCQAIFKNAKKRPKKEEVIEFFFLAGA
jgi:hypothetical protein